MIYICKKAMPFNGTNYDIDEVIAEGDINPNRVTALLRMGVIVAAGEAPAAPIQPVEPPKDPVIVQTGHTPTGGEQPDNGGQNEGEQSPATTSEQETPEPQGEQPKTENAPPPTSGEQPDNGGKKGAKGK